MDIYMCIHHWLHLYRAGNTLFQNKLGYKLSFTLLDLVAILFCSKSWSSNLDMLHSKNNDFLNVFKLTWS